MNLIHSIQSNLATARHRSTKKSRKQDKGNLLRQQRLEKPD